MTGRAEEMTAGNGTAGPDLLQAARRAWTRPRRCTARIPERPSGAATPARSPTFPV